jgi:uncharacterized SAM-binding protein YcdF (DUF218 family)
MIFALTKTLALLLKPLNIMALTALFVLFSKQETRRRRACTLLVLQVLFFSNPWIINALIRRWEIGQINPATISTPYDVGIVLGGYTDMSAAQPPGMVTFSRSGNRLSTALMLYKTGKIRHILLSGGSGKLIGAEASEAPVARWYLQQAGVPDSVIWVEDQSRNTRENARFSRALLDARAPGSRCLLISSAWHLPRAIISFEQEGVNCVPFGTDFFAEQDLGNALHWFEPDWEALMKWEYMVKEWIGWMLHRLQLVD